MSISLINLSIQGVTTFDNQRFYIDFFNHSRVFQNELDEKIVSRLSGSNYKNHIIALAGINASGKTSALNLILFALEVFVKGTSLNESGKSYFSKSSLNSLFAEDITVELCVQVDNYLHLLQAEIFNDRLNGHMFFKDEIVKRKKLALNETKNSYLDFAKSFEEFKRSDIVQDKFSFLKDDDSILPFLLPSNNLNNSFVLTTLFETNFNLLFAFEESSLLHELLRYLDPSIEVFERVESSKNENPLIRLKFYHHNAVELNPLSLSDYLSSGTIKGLNIFTNALRCLKCGGYLLVDEIENHFNKILVENLLNLFQSELNKKNSTLIFSTHYSEILDSVSRMDAIKVLEKSQGKIKIDTLYDLAKPKGKDRSDIKNSDLILSGIFNTAPNYEDYWQLYKKFRSLISKEEKEKNAV